MDLKDRNLNVRKLKLKEKIAKDRKVIPDPIDDRTRSEILTRDRCCGSPGL